MTMNRRVELRRDEDVEDDAPPEAESGDQDTKSDGSTSATNLSSDSDNEDLEGQTDVESDPDPAKDNEVPDGEEASNESLKDISFGALAEAQAALPPKSRKRKASLNTVTNDEPSTKRSKPQQLPSGDTSRSKPQQLPSGDTSRSKPQSQSQPRPKPSRSSKHAPTVLSSKHQVSRHRLIFSPPRTSTHSRDPRFDATIQSHSSSLNPTLINNANKNYSFLSTYQASEILELKAQIKKTTNPETTAVLKRQVMSLEAKLRNAEARAREREIRANHQRKEKTAIAEGRKSKAYYLKESELRKRAEEERVGGMSKRAREKMEGRKVKREKSRQAKYLPRVRRE